MLSFSEKMIKGKQHKLDKNKNGKIDAHDFKLLRKEEQDLEEQELDEAKPGLYANINAKRKRIEAGSKERMRKPGSKGAPSASDFKDAAKTANEEVSSGIMYKKKTAKLKEGSVPDHMQGKQKPYVSSDGKGNHEVLGNKGQTKATFTRKEHGSEAKSKAIAHLKSKYNEYMKEDVDAAAKKVVKTNLAAKHAREKESLVAKHEQQKKQMREGLDESHFKLGDTVKCKASGDQGKVVKLDKEDGKDDDKYYTVKKDNGKTMKFAPNELSLVKESAPFDGGTVRKPAKNSDGTVQTPMSRARELAKRALQRKMKKEETEQIDELSKSTLGSYAKKATNDARIKQSIGKDFEADRSRKPGMKAAAKELADKYKSKSRKREAGVGKAIDRLAKEEFELEEAMINGREYASHGLMHPDHAQMPIHKVSGETIDFYAHGTGDKIQGKVVYHDAKRVHIRDTKGKKHEFKVQRGLPKQQNEETNQGENMKSYKQFVEELVQTTDEALDMNLIKAAQKSAASKPKPQSDSDGAIDPKTGKLLPYGYRGKSEYEKSETGDEPTKRGRKAGMKIGSYKRK
jgi:hypothetical protein